MPSQSNNNNNNSNNSNNSNNNGFIMVNENQKTTAEGEWDNARRLAAVEAMIQHRPFEQRYTQITDAWNRVFEAVNTTSTHLNVLKSSAIKNYISKAREEVRNKDVGELRTTGSNDSETSLENRLRYLDQLMIEAEVSKNKKSSNEISKYNEKRTNQALLTAISMKGKCQELIWF